MRIKYVLLVIFIALPVTAWAHPGNLDKNGCHQVNRDWKYKSGIVLKAGTVHCHRGLDKLKFDGREILEDPDDRGEPVKQKAKTK